MLSECHFRYSAYGLTCWSGLRLPELCNVAEPAVPDLEISQGTVPQRGHRDGAGMVVEVDGDVVWLSHPAVGAFRVCNGRSITVDPAEGIDSYLLRFFVLGPVLGTLLRQRGQLILHASAIDIGGAAVLFVGISGAGKSTIAAALHARGHRLLSDDIAAVDAKGPHPVVSSGFPRVKLDTRAAAAAQMPNAELRQKTSGLGKRYYSANRRFACGSVPLKRVYLLADSVDRDAIEPVSPLEALRELLRHSYGARSLQMLNRETHFGQCAAVARAVPVRLFKRRLGLSELVASAELVENDLAKTA